MHTPSRLKAHISTEMIIKLLEVAEDACWLAVQAMLFFRCEMGLMALGVNGEVISRAYALGTARRGQGLCATPACPRGSLSEQACGCMYAYACQLRPPTAGALDCQPRIWREANTWANKCTLVQSELRMCWYSSASSFTPRAPSWPTNKPQTIKPESKKKNLILNSILLTFSRSSTFHAFLQASNQAMCLEN